MAAVRGKPGGEGRHQCAVATQPPLNNICPLCAAGHQVVPRVMRVVLRGAALKLSTCRRCPPAAAGRAPRPARWTSRCWTATAVRVSPCLASALLVPLESLPRACAQMPRCCLSLSCRLGPCRQAAVPEERPEPRPPVGKPGAAAPLPAAARVTAAWQSWGQPSVKGRASSAAPFEKSWRSCLSTPFTLMLSLMHHFSALRTNHLALTSLIHCQQRM